MSGTPDEHNPERDLNKEAPKKNGNGKKAGLAASTSLTPTDGGNDHTEHGNGQADNVAPFPSTTEQSGDRPPPNSTPLTPSAVHRFRLTSANATSSTEETVSFCRISKPKPSDFIRAHPDPEQKVVCYVFPQKDGDLPISPEVYTEIKFRVPDIHKFVSCVMLVPYVTSLGGVALWPLKMESPFSVGSNSYNLSAFTVLDVVRKLWRRVSSNTDKGIYEPHKTEDEIPEPDWSKVPHIDVLFDLAMVGGEITGIDHPLIKPLRGKRI
jgi:hypothetical protein